MPIWAAHSSIDDGALTGFVALALNAAGRIERVWSRPPDDGAMALGHIYACMRPSTTLALALAPLEQALGLASQAHASDALAQRLFAVQQAMQAQTPAALQACVESMLRRQAGLGVGCVGLPMFGAWGDDALAQARVHAVLAASQRCHVRVALLMPLADDTRPLHQTQALESYFRGVDRCVRWAQQHGSPLVSWALLLVGAAALQPLVWVALRTRLGHLPLLVATDEPMRADAIRLAHARRCLDGAVTVLVGVEGKATPFSGPAATASAADGTLCVFTDAKAPVGSHPRTGEALLSHVRASLVAQRALGLRRTRWQPSLWADVVVHDGDRISGEWGRWRLLVGGRPIADGL